MPFLHIFYSLVVAAVWGVNFVAVKIGMAHFDPLFITALRYVLVVAILLPFVRRPNVAMRQVAVVAVVMSLGHFWPVFQGMKMGLDVGSTILATQMSVPFACLLGAMFFDERLGPWQTGGMVLSFTGLAILAGTPQVASHLGAFLLVVMGAMIWAGCNAYIKRLGDVAALPLLAWMSLFSIPVLLLVSWPVEGNQYALLPTMNWQVVASVVFTAVASTVLGYGLWYHLMKAHPINKVAPFQLLVPVFGIAASHAYFAEQMTAQMWLGGVVVMTGVAIIVFRKPKVVESGEGV